MATLPVGGNNQKDMMKQISVLCGALNKLNREHDYH